MSSRRGQAVTSYREPDNTEFHVVLKRTMLLRKPLDSQIIHSFCLSLPCFSCLKDCFVFKTRRSCRRVVDLKAGFPLTRIPRSTIYMQLFTCSYLHAAVFHEGRHTDEIISIYMICIRIQIQKVLKYMEI